MLTEAFQRNIQKIITNPAFKEEPALYCFSVGAAFSMMLKLAPPHVQRGILKNLNAQNDLHVHFTLKVDRN